MVVSGEATWQSSKDAEGFIVQYYSLLIDDLKVRERLIRLARSVVKENITNYGPQTFERLQQTLEEILDNRLPRKEWDPLSLSTDLTGTGFTLEQVLAAPDEQTDAELEAELVRGHRLQEVIKHSLREEDFQSLVAMIGGADNLASILSSTNLTPKDVSSAGKLKEVIRWVSGLPPETRELYANYSIYQRQRGSASSGRGVKNPISTLDSVSSPVVKRIVGEAYERRTPYLVRELMRLGFFALLRKSHGLRGVVRATAPELFHKIPYLLKWGRGQESVQTALNAIQEMLCTLPSYRMAEETGNRDEQVRIVNELIMREPLAEFFAKAGLQVLMENFVDPEGKTGIRKRQSPKALLQFYSENKGLGWFDRTQPTYVPAWRIKEQGMWKSGEKSAQLTIEAVEDALSKLPGYREAEQAGKREEQLQILGQILQQPGRQRGYFEEAGLSGLMTEFIDPTGRTGLKKIGSVSALLEFYSNRKGSDWFNTAYATHLSANRSGRLVVVDRSSEWSDGLGGYGSKKSYEGTGLEAIVNATLAEYGLQEGVAEFCYMFFSKKDALLSNSFRERVILAHKLQVFLYTAGVIPRTLPNGETRRLGPNIQDLAFMGYSYFTHHVTKGKSRSLVSVATDKPFRRLMMNIVKQATRGAGPSVEEIINEDGQHPLTVQRYGRPVSYDDVLPALAVMEMYMTGQRQVTIRIGEKSIAMVPESVDDLWVLDPESIKLRHDEHLYLFWQRAKKEWPRLVNLAGQRKRVIAYLWPTAADEATELSPKVTCEAIESNPKAKFIKHGALPSSELAKLRVLTVMPKQKRPVKEQPDPETEPARSDGTSESKPKYGGRQVISYEHFRGYVPREQLAAEVFRRRLLERVTRRPIYVGEAVALAQEVGFESRKGNGIEAQVRKILREWPGNMPKIVELVDPNAPNIKAAPTYLGLEKYLGEKGEPVNRVLYGPLEQAVKETHPDYSPKAVHQSAGIIIGMLEHSGVLTRGDLEGLLESGNVDSIRSSSGRGLMSIDPRQRSYLNYFVTACEAAGFDVTKVKALGRELAASSA